MPLDFSESRKAIQRFNQFLQYDMLDKRASQRRMRQEEYANTLAMGRMERGAELEGGLEEKKSGLRMAEAQRKVLLDIARDPRFDQITAMIHLGRVGELPPGTEHLAEEAQSEMKPMLEKLTNALFAVQKGETTPDNYNSLLDGFGSQAAQWATERTSVNINARRQQKIEEERNRIAGLTAGAGGFDIADKYRREQVKYIDDAQGFVANEGAQPSTTALQRLMAQYQAVTGKAPDPLPSKLRGQVLQYLQEIKQSLKPGMVMTPLQERFVAEAYNAYQLRGGAAAPVEGEAGVPPRAGVPGAPAADAGYGNLMDPYTGERQTDEAVAERGSREAQIRMAKKMMQDVMHPPVTTNELAFAKDVEARWATATPDEKQRARTIFDRAYYLPTAEEDAWLMEEATKYYEEVLRPPEPIKR